MTSTRLEVREWTSEFTKARVMTSYLLCAVLIGTGATLLMDLWTLARQRLFSVPALDYALVGRWLGHLLRGKFRHTAIATTPPVRGERLIGWTAHYAIGIAFGVVLLGIAGLDWARHPTIGPALLVSIGSVIAPFLVMQPSMGAGVAASHTPRPGAARLHSLVTHAIFGLGLYVAGWLRALSLDL